MSAFASRRGFALALAALGLASSGCRAVAGVGGDLCLLEADAPAGSVCRLAPPQCGCAPGERCGQTDTGRYCGSAGAVPVGQLCSGMGDCGIGATCLTYNTYAFCSQYCEDDSDCPAASKCLFALVFGGTVCTLPCDPGHTADRCADSACDYSSRVGITLCRTAGAGRRHDPCTQLTDCGVGLTCVGSTTPGQCEPLCGPTVSCAPGETCIDFSFTRPVFAGEYGSCV